MSIESAIRDKITHYRIRRNFKKAYNKNAVTIDDIKEGSQLGYIKPDEEQKYIENLQKIKER